MRAEDVAKVLGGAKRAGRDWMARCPCHEDRKASLAIKDAGDKLLVKCHAGCDQTSVIRALADRGAWPAQPKVEIDLPRAVDTAPKAARQEEKARVVATYDYVDEHGELLFQALRFEPKDFRQRAPNGSWSIKGIRRVPYRLPEVVRAVGQGLPVYIVEGERDVHTAESLGLVATCNPMGADNGTGNKWLPEFAELFKGARVIVVPDQDDPGRRHADWVISTLQGKAKSVARVDLSGHKDLTDFVLDGGTALELVDMAKEVSSPPAPASPEKLFVRVDDLIGNMKPIQWLIKDVIEDECTAQLFGDPGSGKSFVAVDMACSIATGADFHGHTVKKGPVFYIAGEGHNGLARRFAAWSKAKGVSLAGVDIYKSSKTLLVLDEKSVAEFLEHIDATVALMREPPRLIVIDTFARAMAGGNENEAKDTQIFLERLDQLSRRYNRCNIMLVHHSGHGDKTRARGSSNIFATINVEYQVAKAQDGTISLVNTKMKEDEIKPARHFRLSTVELGELDGEKISSAALVEAGESLQFEVGSIGDSKVGRRSVQAVELLRAIMDSAGVITTAAAILGTPRENARRMAEVARERGWLEQTTKNQPYRLSEKALSIMSQAGLFLPRAGQKSGVPAWKQGNLVETGE